MGNSKHFYHHYTVAGHIIFIYRWHPYSCCHTLRVQRTFVGGVKW